ncbi:MAG: hypothetical protein ILO53_02715 [Clostridia bacterium]|nr:hypothetical protein [Clostridia bacterium]
MTLKELARNFKKISGYGDGQGAGAAYRLYNEALDLIAEQNYKEARQLLKTAIRYYPAFDDGYMLLGLTQFACGNRIEALKTINQISHPGKHNTAMKYYDAISGGSATPDIYASRGNTGRRQPSDVPGQSGEGVFAVSDMETKASPDNAFRGGENRYTGDGGSYNGGPKRGGASADFSDSGVADENYSPPKDAPFEKDAPSEGSGGRLDGSSDGRYNGKNETDPEEELIVFSEAPAHRDAPRMTDFERRFKKARESAEEALGYERRGLSGNTGAAEREPANDLVLSNPDDFAEHIYYGGEEPYRGREETYRGGEEIYRGRESGAEGGRGYSAVGADSGAGEASPDGVKTAGTDKETAGGAAKAMDGDRTNGREGQNGQRSPKAPKDQSGQGGQSLRKGGSKKVVMALVVAACILVLAGLGALAASKHLAHIDRTAGTSTASPSPNSSAAPEDTASHSPNSSAAPEDTAEPSETPEATDDPTETATGQETPEPTAEATPEPSDSAADALAAAKAYFNDKNYYDCYVALYGRDLGGLSPQEASEAAKLSKDSLGLFSRDYYNLMYSSVGSEEWEKVLKYALPIIKYNPDYEQGGAVYFHAGKACELLGDAENARKYYQETMTRFAGTAYEEYARYRLSTMPSG